MDSPRSHLPGSLPTPLTLTSSARCHLLPPGMATTSPQCPPSLPLVTTPLTYSSHSPPPSASATPPPLPAATAPPTASYQPSFCFHTHSSPAPPAIPRTTPHPTHHLPSPRTTHLPIKKQCEAGGMEGRWSLEWEMAFPALCCTHGQRTWAAGSGHGRRGQDTGGGVVTWVGTWVAERQEEGGGREGEEMAMTWRWHHGADEHTQHDAHQLMPAMPREGGDEGGVGTDGRGGRRGESGV
ncbi:unnamed protein product [Closterium sp. Naga37s-1]|nr:unnamed protein product [Closterium sp. Naga37s-1]